MLYLEIVETNKRLELGSKEAKIFCCTSTKLLFGMTASEIRSVIVHVLHGDGFCKKVMKLPREGSGE